MDKMLRLLETIKEYDIVSFDIFDTLISRYTLKPTDVFKVVETECIAKYDFGENFQNKRIRAEQKCYEKYGKSTNLENIYSELLNDNSYSKQQCDILKSIEKDTESNVVIPRRDILKLFKEVSKSGKKIILCSDMYLSSSFLQKLLNKCGYPDNLDILVSNEAGCAKYDGTLWKFLFQKYGQSKVIHIGDNKNSDVVQAEKHGIKGYYVENAYDKFSVSDYYNYLCEYDDGNVAHSLLLGYLVNNVLYNSPFDNELSVNMTAPIWMGPLLLSFIEWLVATKDDSHLLFVTREGYILKPLYEYYCQNMEIEPQENSLFYASRTATSSAAIINDKELEINFDNNYNGSLKKLIKSRLNFEMPNNCLPNDVVVKLPAHKDKVMKLLSKYVQEIYKQKKIENEAYRIYLAYNNPKKKPITIVDVGYNGTIQYNLSRIANEKISGKYMFLDIKPLPISIGCACNSLCKVSEEVHPVFENLLFLEGFMQVPYGQLQKISFGEKGNIEFFFNDDINTSRLLEKAQDTIFEFISWAIFWKKKMHINNFSDINLAEVIWLCMIYFNDIPQNLIDSFKLADSFHGNTMWKYNRNKKEWQSDDHRYPLVFSLENKGKFKYKIKQKVKSIIPSFMYDFCGFVWVKFIK